MPILRAYKVQIRNSIDNFNSYGLFQSLKS